MLLTLLLACSDYGFHTGPDRADPLQYQTAVLDFMCSATCTWESEATCWEDLEAHWAFCLDGDEALDPGLAEECMAIMESARLDNECTWLPDECMVSAVIISHRDEVDSCRSR